MKIVVEPLTPDRYHEAVSVLARAFFNDPTWGYVFPDLARRPAQLAAMFACDVRMVAPLHASFVAAGDAGAALWIPPEHSLRLSWWLGVRAGFLALPLRIGPAALFRIWPIYRDAERRQHAEVIEPHWVLHALGVDPAAQGRGLGDALVRIIFERADGDRIPCYVMTHNPANVAFYERFGFRLVNQGIAASTGCVASTLRRAPKV